GMGGPRAARMPLLAGGHRQLPATPVWAAPRPHRPEGGRPSGEAGDPGFGAAWRAVRQRPRPGAWRPAAAAAAPGMPERTAQAGGASSAGEPGAGAKADARALGGPAWADGARLPPRLARRPDVGGP